MKPLRLLLLFCLILLTLTLTTPPHARADVAPPSYPPGSSISSGEENTQVEMTSESVLMTIHADGPPPDSASFGGRLATNAMSGDVEAEFVMHNTGGADEMMDVRFPIGTEGGSGAATTVENFAAWVNDVPAAITTVEEPGQYDYPIPWATWPVTFPAGQDMIIRVTYKDRPTGYSPHGTFGYILETGAGWNGPIGQGTVTFRLPYFVNDQNTALLAGDSWFSVSPAYYTVSGTDVTWTFSNLEPTSADNIQLTVMESSVWEEIRAARKDAAENSDDAAAQLRLARALLNGVQFKYGLIEIGSSAVLAGEAEAAYERVMTLEPDNVEVIAEYVDFLWSLERPFEQMGPRGEELLAHGLALDPENETLLHVQSYFAILEPDPSFPTRTPLPTPGVYTPEPEITAVPTEVAQGISEAPTQVAALPPGIEPTPAPSTPPPDRVCPPLGLLLLAIPLIVESRQRT